MPFGGLVGTFFHSPYAPLARARVSFSGRPDWTLHCPLWGQMLADTCPMIPAVIRSSPPKTDRWRSYFLSVQQSVSNQLPHRGGRDCVHVMDLSFACSAGISRETPPLRKRILLSGGTRGKGA